VAVEARTLPERVAAVVEKALGCGALLPLSTRRTFIEDGGVRFLVYILENLERKKQARQEQVRASTNPFLPHDKDLFVSEISANHLLLLNKYNVLYNHLLLVTRKFEAQESLLTTDDFAALFKCMGQFDGLAFYNGGEVAGASQPHKHLQLVPLPEEIDPLTAINSGRLPGALARLDREEEKNDGALVAYKKYRGLLEEVGLGESGGIQTGPYNLLLTRQWMFVVARSREHFGPISINSLGFVGSLLVRNGDELKLLEDAGPMAVLEGVVASPG
jgi:sulfate adenylyltransferase (ADP) / ATP adenylyltransferase